MPVINYHDEPYYWKDVNGENLQIVDWQSTSASGWRVRYSITAGMKELARSSST